MAGRSARALIVTAAAFGALALPAAASAADRFVSPNPANPGNATCSQADPCSLEHAIEDVALDGETVKVAPGDYVQTGSDLSQGEAPETNIDVVAKNPAIPPRVELQSATWVLRAGSHLTDVGVTGVAGPGGALNVAGTSGNPAIGSTVRRATVNVTGDAAHVGPAGTVTDSVLVGTTGAFVGLGGSNEAIQLFNVTAVATGAGAHGVEADGGPGTAFLIANMSIARGGPGGSDFRTDQGGSLAIILSQFSNYADSSDAAGGPAVGTGGGDGDQTSPAQTDEDAIFVDFDGGDFHQLPTAPTVNAGANLGGSQGTTDFEGDPRIVGPNPDIGADELATHEFSAPASVDLGGSNLAAPKVGAIDLESSGTGRLSITGASITGPAAADFSADVEGCSTIGPGETCSVPVTFTPTVAGSRSATLELATNDGPQSIALSGAGIGPPAPDPDPAGGGGGGDPGGGGGDTTPPPDPGPGPAADTDPPETTLERVKPKGTTRGGGGGGGKLRFELSSDEAGTTFQCSLDDGVFKPCKADYSVKPGKKGKHSLRARAIDAAGNADPTPAKQSWKVKGKPKKD